MKKSTSTSPLVTDSKFGASPESGIFGLFSTEEESALIYLPIPWEATTSYGGGTSHGPAAILGASHQVDLYDADVIRPYEAGMCMLAESPEVHRWNGRAKNLAASIIQVAGRIEGNKILEEALLEVNRLSEQVNELVYSESRRILAAGKILAVIGGDHSVPFGALKAIGEKHPSFGVLHFDAHSDTRDAYEGFTWSHASIMYNALQQIPALSKLVQVGIRDYCEDEKTYLQEQGARAKVFFDRDLKESQYEGIPWKKTCETIVSELPQEVWISFDIDGLDPRFCPHTGTPVPGGLDFNEALYLIGSVVRSGRKIIGFDLNEVAPNLNDESDEWDANVGARLLYKLSAWTLASLGKAELSFRP